MFRKFLLLLTLCVWVNVGVAEEKNMAIDAVADCPAPCPPEPCAPPPPPKVCPLPECPKPCSKPCNPCPKPCPPKPCPKPCCVPPPPCCWKFNPCNPKGCTNMNCGGFYVAADFLYWRAENHGFSYAFELDSSADVGSNDGDIVRVDPSWDPAFRAGIGWNTAYDFWDIFLNYTWYRNNASETRSSSVGFIPLWPVNDSQTGLFESVSAKTRFTLNMGDLEIGRQLYLTKTVAVRPYWGARGGTLYQKFSNSYGSPLTAVTQQTFSGKNNYWGVGPRAGVNGEFHLSYGLSFLGKCSGSLLYGKTNTNASTTRTPSSAGFPRNHSDDFYQLVPNLQLALGLQWQTCFWCEKMFYRMSASWETNYWWNQFNLPFGYEGTFAPLPTVGNQPLTMEGLTVNFEWDF